MLSAYTRSEVVWLLSMTRDQAIQMDATPRDSCAGFADADEMRGGDDDSVPVIARWADVQRARRQVVREKEDLATIQLRAGGFSERELGKLAGRDRMTIRRRWHATVTEILERLGGIAEGQDTLSHVDLCLQCGQRPRVRLVALRTRAAGTPLRDLHERQAAVCEQCIDPELAHRIVTAQTLAA